MIKKVWRQSGLQFFKEPVNNYIRLHFSEGKRH